MISEERFPEDISYGSSGGPVFSTSITSNAAGYEKRNSRWAEARAVYNVAHGVKTEQQLQTLIAFFRARKGRAQAFRFKDWTDYQGIAEFLGIGNGSRTAFPLVKHYQSGEDVSIRRIYKPVTGTVQVFVNAVLQANSLTIDNTNGMVIFSTAPANGAVITADFDFDVPVRFETDQLAASLDDYGVYSWGEIPLVEVRI